MLSNFLKVCFFVISVFGCIYCINTFGYNIALVGVMVCSSIIFISIFIDRLKGLAKILGSMLGVASLLSLGLLLLAGNMGGSFSLSPSNEVLANFLFFIALFGFTSFFWSVTNSENT